MLIYQGTTDEFVRLNRMNRIADVMGETFFSFTGRHAGQSEYNSWQNSLTRLRDLVKVAELKEKEKTGTARLEAGFCWPWSNPNPDGSLVNDVKIGDFAMPWETKGDQWAGEYPPWHQWAIKEKGFEQVGCIYTAQGFEFDYIGVIIGPDLVYDSSSDRLKADITTTRDPVLKRNTEHFEEYVKNIYRVLMSRGMKGCYVYFADKEMEAYFQERIVES